ncbi:MAG TPA: tetratricopeptide repeat protein [bacterium]
MENLGLNNDVLVGGRKFHIQTSYSDANRLIQSKVFNEGQVIESREVPVDGAPIDEINSQLNDLHQEQITEMEILYYIYEKVKAVRHASSSHKLGLLFLKKSLVKEAIEQFKLALEIDPGLYQVYASLGRALLINGSYDEAIASLQEAVQKASDYADINNYLGVAYLYQEKFPQAVQYLSAAIRLNENYIGAHYYLGVAHLALSLNQTELGENTDEDYRQAMEHINLAVDRLVDRQIPSFKKVLDLVQGKSYKEAVNAFLNSTPKEDLTHFMNMENEFYLKFMYGGKGKDDAFIADYVQNLRELLDQHPGYADVRNNLGIAYLIQCRNLFLKALEEFRAALKINANFKKAEKNLKLAENDGKGFLILLRAILK